MRTRPQTKPLSNDTSRGLNILFLSISIFFFLSLPIRKGALEQNVFAATGSRLHVPTDVLFSRLSNLRPNGLLTSADEALKMKITTPVYVARVGRLDDLADGLYRSRQLYLKFGPSTISNCAFCHVDDPLSYVLYYLSVNVLLPHLVHLTALGLATSEPLAGLEAKWWRNRCTLGALALAIVDIYMTMTYEPTIDVNMPSPGGMFWTARTIRPLAICILDAFIAFLVYASATNRFVFFTSPTGSDPEILKKRQEQLLAETNIALQMAQTKLRAFSVARNATVRDQELRATDDEYWRAVVDMEGPGGTAGVWEDEEVQAAIARSYGDGSFDPGQMGREAEAFVSNITRGLENNS